MAISQALRMSLPMVITSNTAPITAGAAAHRARHRETMPARPDQRHARTRGIWPASRRPDRVTGNRPYTRNTNRQSQSLSGDGNPTMPDYRYRQASGTATTRSGKPSQPGRQSFATAGSSELGRGRTHATVVNADARRERSSDPGSPVRPSIQPQCDRSARRRPSGRPASPTTCRPAPGPRADEP